MVEKKYDLSFLKRISNEDQAFILDMLETFRKTAPGIISRMELHIRKKKYDALSREAHRFIPGISFLGAKDLEKELVDIEKYSKNKENVELIPNLIDSVKKNVNTLIQCFIDDFNLQP